MSEHRMVRFGVAALLLLLLLGAGAAAVQQSAWSQGYMMGLIAGNGEGDALTQFVLYNSGRMPSLAGGFGAIFKAGLLLFGALFVAKFFFGMAYMRRWSMAGGPDGGWHGHHHSPPWHKQGGEQSDGQPVQAHADQPTPSEPRKTEAEGPSESIATPS